jgi:hypothetical protein
VYEVVGRLLGRSVAINVLAPPFDCVGGFVERFRRGARGADHLS